MVQRDIAAGLKALKPVSAAVKAGQKEEDPLEVKLREGIAKFRFDDTATIGFSPDSSVFSP